MFLSLWKVEEELSQPRLGQWLARSELSWVSGGSVLLWNEWAHGGRKHCIAGPKHESVLEFGWAESQAHKWICAAAETAAQIMTQGKKPPEKLEVWCWERLNGRSEDCGGWQDALVWEVLPWDTEKKKKKDK